MMNQLRHYLSVLAKWRLIGFWLLVLALFGYTLLKIQALSNPKPDQAYITAQQTQQPTKIDIPDSLRAQLEHTTNTRVNVNPGNTGHSDPFNP